MNLDLCQQLLGPIALLAALFMLTSLMLGVAYAITVNRDMSKRENLDPGTVLQGLKDLIQALVNAPAWFAIFLAGFFLFWLAGSTYVSACKKPEPTTSSSTTTTRTELVTRTIPPSAQPHVNGDNISNAPTPRAPSAGR